MSEDKVICQEFANEHKLIFEDEGECGFGRECVGLLDKSGSWISYNPAHGDNYEPVEGMQCDSMYAPDDVDSYHKHECVAVLGRGDDAIKQLATWIKSIKAAGNVEVLDFATGHTGIQAMMGGLIGYALVCGERK